MMEMTGLLLTLCPMSKCRKFVHVFLCVSDLLLLLLFYSATANILEHSAMDIIVDSTDSVDNKKN